MLKKLLFYNLRPSLFLILVLTMFFMNCNNAAEKKYSKKDLVPISVGINRSLKSAPIVIAENLDYFKQNGIKAEITMKNSSVPLMNQFFANKLDIICVPEHLVAFEALKNKGLRVIAVLNRNQSQELIINKKSGISEISALRDHRIGVMKKSGSFYTLYRLLLYNNLNLSEVNLVDLEIAELPDKLVSGELDAMIAWPPFTTIVKEKLGETAISFNAHMGRDLYWVLLAKDELCQKNSAVIERFLNALQLSFNYIKDSPENAKNVSANYFGFPAERVANEWDLYDFGLELPQSLIIAMEQEAQWKIDQLGEDIGMPNFLNFIEQKPLEKLFPELVNLRHK